MTNRLFVGNLSFSTTAAELGQLFEGAGNDVENATIIAFAGRSKGYGFVTLKDEATALKALSELNKKDLGGRSINVEIAKPLNPHPRNNDGPRRFPQRQFQNRNFNQWGGYQNRGPFERQRFFRQRRPVDPNAALSKTRLHLGGLPYRLTEDELKQVFKDYQVKEVVLPKLRDGRASGYGFIEFNTEEQAKKALDEQKDLVIKERRILLAQARERQVQTTTPAQTSSSSSGTEPK